jgi:hypothetical protein
VIFFDSALRVPHISAHQLKLKRNDKLSVYDVYGFVVAVEGPVDKAFSEEYGYFKISESPQKIDLFVKVNDAQRSLPTKLYGCLKGMYIPFDEDEKTLGYDDGVALSKALYYFECLMWWPSKTSLHAGTVAKNGKAFVFTGGGGVGKTSIVLNLLKNGYDFLGDDWLIIEGNKAFPFPRRVHIFDYNLKDEEIAKQVLGWKRYYYKPMLKLFESGGRLAPHKYPRFAFERLREQAMLSVDVQKTISRSRSGLSINYLKNLLLRTKKNW